MAFTPPNPWLMLQWPGALKINGAALELLPIHQVFLIADWLIQPDQQDVLQCCCQPEVMDDVRLEVLG